MATLELAVCGCEKLTVRVYEDGGPLPLIVLELNFNRVSTAGP